MSTNTQNRGYQRKKPRTASRVQLDYISNLPDDLISEILSRLPMMDAVRTSILSKDWEDKWTSIFKIELNDYKPINRSTKRTFVNFVERTLLLSHDYQSFRLLCYKTYDSSVIETWISTALTRGLHCLEIYYSEAGIVLPRNLVDCNSLRKLVLNIPCTFRVPAKICFQHLTALCLKQVAILNEIPNSDQVKFDFPVLETFELIECEWLNFKCVEFYAPKRTTFKYKAPRGTSMNNYLIKIIEDGLVKLESCDSLPGNIVLSGGLEVVHAQLSSNTDDLLLLEKIGVQVRKQLKGLLSLTDLYLWGTTAKAIALAELRLPLPMYSCMQRLYMKGFGNVQALLELLHAAPCLKILDTDVTSNDYDYDAEENVPLCVASHLEVVKLREFIGTTPQFKLAMFLLKNALQLKKVYFIGVHNEYMPRNRIKKELSRYPKASTCLTISITTGFVPFD